jgi:sigma-B regulation protein RsbU (phosphoserine phosphatase)
LAGTEMVARNRQARQVGGDYYDVIPFEDDPCHLLCVADISGKGLSAALLMANIQATLRALAAGHSDLRTIAARTSDLLWASTPSNKYATAFLGRYDPMSGRLEYVNAGHAEGVLLRSSGQVELLDSTGLPVGMLPRRTFDSGVAELAPGDLLCIYSDGVTDACKADDSQFGLDNAIECLKSHSTEPLDTICDRLYEAIDAFAEGTPQFDDITVMLLRRTT